MATLITTGGERITIEEWFARRGVPGYREQISNLIAQRNEIVAETAAEGGVSWFGDHRTQLAAIDAEIGSIRQAALDRYEDLASD